MPTTPESEYIVASYSRYDGSGVPGGSSSSSLGIVTAFAAVSVTSSSTGAPKAASNLVGSTCAASLASCSSIAVERK